MIERLLGTELREPVFVWLALLAPLVFLWARRPPGRVVFSSLGALPTSDSWRVRLAFVPDLLLSLSVVALAVAAAGPRTPDQKSRVKREGIAVMMVVDRSGSMRALDLSTDDEEKTRLDAVQDVFSRFVLGGDGLSGRPDDAVGLVTFARYADTPCPLTLDHENLVDVAQQLTIVTERKEDGTAIGDGLGLAVERLREATARSRVAILLTDGVNNAGDETPLGAAEVARAVGVKVYTVGAGSEGMAPIRVKDPFTGEEVLRPTRVEIDEETLRSIAERTGGRYFRATDAAALDEVYAEIDRLERADIVEERFNQYREHYRWPLLFGLGLAVLAFLLRETALRRGP